MLKNGLNGMLLLTKFFLWAGKQSFVRVSIKEILSAFLYRNEKRSTTTVLIKKNYKNFIALRKKSFTFDLIKLTIRSEELILSAKNLNKKNEPQQIFMK